VALAAVTNTVMDALAHLGVKITEQFLPLTRILELAGAIKPVVRNRVPAQVVGCVLSRAAR
jgi:hypothetical protein